MSNPKILTALLHLQDFDDYDDQKFLLYADFSIRSSQNLTDAMGSVQITKFNIKN